MDPIGWQEAIVAVFVTAALVVSTWKLMPARRRLKILLSIDAWAARRPALGAWRARLIAPRIERAVGSGCSGCSDAGARPHAAPRANRR